MNTEIHQLSLGMCRCFLIREERTILVDTGFPNQAEKFQKELKALAIEPEEISLIFLTHGHYDHIGSANDIKRITGAELAINYREKDWVEQALKPLPPPVGLTGRMSGVIVRMMANRMSFPGTSVDLALEDGDFSLESYGISGKVIYTPGHSSGSMSLLLDTGDAFVGDLAMNGFPMRFGCGMPVFTDDTDRVKESWRLLLDNGVKWIYSAHGKPFQEEKLRKLL
jgi:glyoxylase-like metal-dependent hydrolase (beta-lactamase superfamily II)